MLQFHIILAPSYQFLKIDEIFVSLFNQWNQTTDFFFFKYEIEFKYGIEMSLLRIL